MFGQKPERALRDTKARLSGAHARREAIIDALIQDDEAALMSRRRPDLVRVDELAAEVDAIQAEIDLCTFELRARMLANGSSRAERRPVHGSDADRHAGVGLFGRLLTRFLAGAAARAA